MGQLVRINFGGDGSQPLSKKRLAAILGRSTRWVELRCREGLPSTLDRRGHRVFRENEVRAWLANRGRAVGGAHG
jgi:hypothetical protein